MVKEKKDINNTDNNNKNMAICPICGQRVTNERGGGASYKGRLYHKSCLKQKLRVLHSKYGFSIKRRANRKG